MRYVGAGLLGIIGLLCLITGVTGFNRMAAGAPGETHTGEVVAIVVVGGILLLIAVLCVVGRKEPRIVRVSQGNQGGQGGRQTTPVKERCPNSGLQHNVQRDMYGDFPRSRRYAAMLGPYPLPM